MNRSTLFIGLLATGLLSLSAVAARSASDPAFASYWHDGNAELDGYRLTIQRYGHERTGRAVAVFVTEPFSRSRHVKLDDPTKSTGDALDVLKLNLIRDFQTGIYDYHTILTLFADADDFSAPKVAFSCSEWCGQVYEELNVSAGTLTQRVASYFEGESAQRTLVVPAGGIQEDQLFVLLRGLRGPFLAPSQRRSLPFLASPFYRRLAHRPTVWADATIERLSSAQSVRVPAGTFETDAYVIHPADGRTGRFDVERAYPHRIIRWSWKPAPGASPLGGTDAGELTGSRRLQYWRTHDHGDERLLDSLGIAPGVK